MAEKLTRTSLSHDELCDVVGFVTGSIVKTASISLSVGEMKNSLADNYGIIASTEELAMVFTAILKKHLERNNPNINNVRFGRNAYELAEKRFTLEFDLVIPKDEIDVAVAPVMPVEEPASPLITTLAHCK